MTETPAAAQENPPLWSNQRIGALHTVYRLKQPTEVGWFDYEKIRAAIRQVRDDYERERRQLYAQIAALQEQLRLANDQLVRDEQIITMYEEDDDE